MAVTPTPINNPNSGLILTELMDSEALLPANNLSDLPDRSLALQNLAGYRGVTVTVTALAGAANVSTISVQVVDVNGTARTGIHWLWLLTASDAAGGTISAAAYSGTLVAVTGTIPLTVTAKHAFMVATDATGLFVGSLTDTAKTADYIAVKRPSSAALVVSPAMAFG